MPYLPSLVVLSHSADIQTRTIPSQVLALKSTVLLLLTLLIKAKVQILAGSALGIALLLLQALVFLDVSGGLVLAAGGATLYATKQCRPAAA